MRVLIANDQHWPMKSGVATAGRTLAQGLAALGHEVLVVAPSQTGRGYSERDENYDIMRIRSFGLPFRKNLRVSVTYDREMRRVLDEFQPDIVHVQTQLTVGLSMLRAAVKRNIPVVATNHVMPDNMIKNIKILSPISRPVSYILSEYGTLLYRGTKRIVMPTESALGLFNLSRIEAPAVAISNGINLDKFKPGKPADELYEKFHIPRNKPLITYIGRLDEEKHVHILVHALELLHWSGHDFHAVIVGHGNAVEGLHELVETMRLNDNVTFTGLVSDEDLIQLHRLGDVYVMPSPTELQCLAMLEAMASGKPVVAVDAGALGELCLNDQNGYLVRVDDIEAMAQALMQLLDHPRRRRSFGKRSLEIAKQHDVRMVMPKFVELYEQVIAENS
ncbi:MAG: 1,2-diacylglycerol 3-alpha-glucosyltransferase [Patescibacteria group bacterium]|nr:1,2-diacylglycerol 3-alpha-glucosyltransferase [Patescibacteria group bacterium]